MLVREFSPSAVWYLILSFAIFHSLNSLQQFGLTAMAEQDELTNVLESLVNDNEILKGDNAELQRLLAESREDLHGLQEKLEEQRVNMVSSPHRRLTIL